MFGDIMQPTHLLFVLAVALLVLGPKRLPEVGKSLGSGIRDFRDALTGDHHETAEHPEPDLVGPTTPAAVPEPAPVDEDKVDLPWHNDDDPVGIPDEPAQEHAESAHPAGSHVESDA